ncbi:MAG: NADPH:quinone oxidoreductase family protein [Alcanivoracaceae bacterium]
MRALQVEAFGDPSALKVSDIAERAPSPGEVQVRVVGVGVGYFDGLLIKGEYQIKPPLPFVPGSSFSGTVTEVGDGVTHLKAGDAVAGFAFMGAMAERLTLPAMSCFPLPPALNLEDAANFFIAYATGLYGLREIGNLKAGETLLVLGASGTTGSTAIEIAKAMGARVIACAGTDTKRQRCLAAGADAVIDYNDPEWRKAAKAAAGSKGIDVVYDPVGGATAEPALRMLNPGGRFLVVGFVTGIASVPLNLMLLKQCSIHGVNWGGAVMTNPAIVPPVISTLVEWTLAGKLSPQADQRYPLAGAGEAFAALFERRSIGKIVICPQE